MLKRGNKIGQLSIYGQEFNPTTWRLASMNMAIRGLDFDFGKEPASTYTRPQHPDLRADFIMANPPFNRKAWNVALPGAATGQGIDGSVLAQGG